MNEYLSRLICLQNGSLSIIDRENRTLNECFLTTYLQVPSYLAFTVLNAFALGSSSQMPRLIRHRTLTILRLISTLILLISMSEIFLKYFTSLYPEWDPNEPLFCTQLVVEFYKLAAFSLNVFVLFNRNVFRRVFPLTLLVSLFALVFVNLTFYGNRIYASTKTFDEMALFERIEILKMTFYNSLLLMYLLTVLLGFGVESLRVIDLDIPPEALYNQQPEEDEASYFSYLSFRWLQRLMKKGFRREIASIDDLCQLPRNLDINRVFTVFLSRFVKTKHNEYLNSPIIEPNLLLNNEYIEKFSIRYEDEVIRQRSLMNQCFQIQNGLIRTMWKSFGGKFMVLGVIKFLNDCLSFAGPLLLNQLVQFIEFNDTSLKNGLTYATALFLSTLACALLNVHFTHSLNKLCLRVRISLISLVYRKCAIAKLNELGKLSLGEILNYMSIDCDSIVNMLPSFHSLWSLPFQIVITLYLLYDQIGISFLVGVGFVIVLIPINKFISDFIGKVQTKLMTYKDERVNIMTEFLDGIRVIKFYSWEKYFLTRIDQVREKELGRLRAKKYLDAGCVYFWATTPILMSVFTFITYVYIGNKLTPSKVFTSLALFNMLIGPLNSFPWVINGLVQAYVSIKRVQRYLNLGNLNWLEYYSFNELENSSSQPETIIELRNATFSWKSNAQRDGTEEADQSLLEAAELPVLRDLNISVKRGQFIGVIGKVGAGKSSLLHAILAEIEKLNDSSRVRIDAKICAEGFAYVSQECWIQGSSIRENILFGSPYDPDLYARVVYACALEADLAQLPHGDATPVGENGICLSGGQKARLTLARACYTRSQKSLFLLDDPLSAVDSHVAQHIFAHCITGLLGDKTRVLCTHHVKFLVDADLVIVLDSSGVVRESGRGRDIVPPYLERDQVHGITVGLSKRKQIEIDEGESSTAQAPSQVISEDVIKKFNEQEEIKRDEEEKEHGVISSSIYMFYSKSIGLVLCFLTILFLALMQASKNLTDFWLSYWTQHHGSSNSSLSKSPSSSRTTSPTTYILNPSAQTHFYTPHGFINSAEAPDDDTKYFFIVYLSLCGANTLFTFVRAFLFAYSGITAGKRIHNKLIQSLSHATLKFFDMTPRGRIINRLSSDMYTIDDSLPFILNIFLACIFGLVGILVVTCYSLPWFALILIPLFIIYYTIQNYYRWTSRELKRLSSLALSPVYNHFNETLKGLITIRAFRQVSNFLGQHDSYVENYIRASYSSMSAGQWLNFRLHALSVVMIAFVGFVAVFQHIYSSSAVNASLIGLALSYVLNVTGYLNGLIGSFTETEKELVSVERAHQFADLPQENWSGRIENVEMNWPRRPEIEFSEVKLSYTGNLDSCALNGVSFKINAGEKIGICGRTGSGKSSLLMALFRAVELSEGSILIDGLNIRDLNLKDLRERLSIIPQEPFLFRSTLRANLDPSGTKSDHELWSALRDVHLDLKFRAIESSGIGLNGGGLSCGLDWSVDDKGKNLSAGERQLVCLARAILANRSIICIDEATASVDYETDAFIQTTIRDKFKSVTVLTVAHRINTIFDYDRILVMSDGRVAEFDTVANLLENKNSIFSRLCDESNRTKK